MTTRSREKTDPPVVIRTGRLEDAPRLTVIEDAADALLIDLLTPVRWAPAPDGEVRLGMPGFVLVVSESAEAEPVGFVHVIELEGVAHLEQLSVEPGHTRRGLGRALVEAAKAEAGERGYESITLRTYADVPWNAPFYATCGFVQSEPETAFHRELVETEQGLGLAQYGRRIQMTAKLPRTR